MVTVLGFGVLSTARAGVVNGEMKAEKSRTKITRKFKI
jgi:hypothetical protein